MKKFLLAAACFAALNASDVLIDLDLMYADTKRSDMTETLDSFKLNIQAQTYKAYEDDMPLVGKLKYGMHSYNDETRTTAIDASETKTELDITLSEFDMLGGYGMYFDNGSFKSHINLLGGVSLMSIEREAKTTTNTTSTTKSTIKTKALKAGVSALVRFDSGIIASAEAYAKHYLDDKRLVIAEKGKDDSKTKFEIDGAIGYKFGNDNSGFITALKTGYHNNLMGHGLHVGLNLGYIF